MSTPAPAERSVKDVAQQAAQTLQSVLLRHDLPTEVTEAAHSAIHDLMTIYFIAAAQEDATG